MFCRRGCPNAKCMHISLRQSLNLVDDLTGRAFVNVVQYFKLKFVSSIY